MKKLIVAVLLSVMTLLYTTQASETIGPWTVTAPVSATANFSSDGGWLNIVNSAVTINDAFSGSPILDDGVANISLGDYYQVTFGTPVLNGPGPELVIFEARYDDGNYSVSVDYDSFASTSSVPNAVFIDSGIDTAYYYGGSGPHGARIWGAAIDLSDLGVPVGASVTQVRVIAADYSCDPIGIGALTSTVSHVSNDYDGDGKSDQAVLNTAAFNSQTNILTGRWYVKTLMNTVIAWEQWWGWEGAVPVPGDYDGDGKCDLAVCFTNTGLWYAFSLDNGVVIWENQWGWSGAVTVPGDYDGDGQADLAVFNDQTGHWFIKTMAETVLAWELPWGEPKDIPLAGDYDGDGTDDLALFNQDNGYWSVYSLTKGVIADKKLWGWNGAIPVRGDYDGDGADDLALFDQINGDWYIYSLAKGGVIAWEMNWGWNGAIPVHGDYDGDGAADLAVFNNQTGRWYIITVNGTVLAWEDWWGWNGATPVSGP